jgi:tetrahydromethanopterin S-methyltransferase subunit G
MIKNDGNGNSFCDPCTVSGCNWCYG